MVFIPRCFPNHKRPVMNGFLGFAQSLGLVTAPIIGGALTDAFTWRACFGINVPIGVVAVAITSLWMKDPPIRTWISSFQSLRSSNGLTFLAL